MRLQIASYLFLFIFIFQNPMKGQKRFALSAVAGLNIAQIDGDNISGFDQLGVVTGLNFSAYINKTFNIDIELLYSQRGASTGPIRRYNSDHQFDINLVYAEVPILVKFKLDLVKKKSRKENDWFRTNLVFGLSINRLIKAEINERRITTLAGPVENVSYLELVEAFEENEINLIAAYSHRLSKKFGFSFRFTFGITALYKENIAVENDRTLRNYYLSGFCFYTF